MLNQEQEEWVNHLSDESKILIVPFDPTSEEKFKKIKLLIQSRLGENIRVEHHGASSLRISGQDEIDIYVPVPLKDFDNLLMSLTALFGKPRSHYPKERARFVTFEEEKHIDVFLTNEESENWLNHIKFENYLRINPKALKEYRILKESCNGLSTREYYRKKIEFINSILDQE